MYCTYDGPARVSTELWIGHGADSQVARSHPIGCVASLPIPEVVHVDEQRASRADEQEYRKSERRSRSRPAGVADAAVSANQDGAKRLTDAERVEHSPRGLPHSPAQMSIPSVVRTISIAATRILLTPSPPDPCVLSVR